MKKAVIKIGFLVVLVGLTVLLVLIYVRPTGTSSAILVNNSTPKVASPDYIYKGKPSSFWIEQLKSQDAEARRTAVEALVAIGEPAYAAISQFLNTPYKPDDKQNIVLNRAIASFAELGPSAVPALLAAVRLDKSGDLRHNGGVAALLKMDSAAFPGLEKALQHPNKDVRASSVVALRFFAPSGKITPTLTSALIAVLKKDPDPEVRFEALMSLSFFHAASKEVTSALMEALADKNERVRVQAAYGLASIGIIQGKPISEATAGLPVLIEALKSENEEARFQAAMALQFLGPAAKPAIPLLSTVLEDPEMGQWAADALGAIGGDALEVLQKAANSSNRAARNNATQVLGRLGYHGKISADALLSDLKKPDPQVRMAAATSIQSTIPDDPRVVPALIEALKDKEKYVRERVAYALSGYGPKANAAVPALMNMLSADSSNGMAAIFALGAIGPAAKPAIPILRAAMAKERYNGAGKALAKMGPAGLATLTSALKDKNKDVRSQVMDGLFYLGADAEPALPSLIDALDDTEPGVRNFAAQTLGAIGPSAKSAVSKLIMKLQDKDKNVRAWAAHALGQIGTGATSAIPALTVATTDVEKGARWEAVESLVLLGAGQKAVPALVKIIEDKKDFMRTKALSLLKQIGASAHASADPLVKILNDATESPFLRLASAVALSSIEPTLTTGVSFLRKSLKDPDERIRLTTVAGLAELHTADREIVTTLRPLLRSNDKHAAVTAGYLLATLNQNDQSAIDFLSNALQQEDKQVSFAAAKAFADLRMPTPKVVGVLVERLQDRNLGWGIQRESILALGKLGTSAHLALPVLEKFQWGNDIDMPTLRQAVVTAIKQIRGEQSLIFRREESLSALFDRLVESGGKREWMGIR